MATKRDVEDLAERVSSGLRLDPGGQLLDMEDLVYKASPQELETLRQQVLQKQSLSGFDDEGLIRRIVQATKPKSSENGGGDNNQSSYFNCFQNQIMLPTVVDKDEQLPSNLTTDWLCMVCPEANRVLVVASHKSTRAYDMEGTWICEHDTHLPGGSPSEASKVEDDGQCTILDCLYNDENEIYYVVDLLCWKGHSFYKYETSVRMTTLREKMKELSSIKQVSQTNPFRFYTLPTAESSEKNAISGAIAKTNFEITGLLFYHKRALYLPGLSPLGIWVETCYIPSVMGIPPVYQQQQLQGSPRGKQDWRKTRYETGGGGQEVEEEEAEPGQARKAPARSRAEKNNNRSRRGRGQYQAFPNYAPNSFFPSFGGAGYNYSMLSNYGNYPQGYYNQGYNMPNYSQAMGYNRSGYNFPQMFNQSGAYRQRQRGGYQQQKQAGQQTEGKKGKKKNKGGDGGAKKLQVSIPIPDERPNWLHHERHSVMMSVNMEYIPENFETEYVAVICPVAKRRICVSFLGWTCSYNKLQNMDRKFQSSLPGGNLRSIQVIKSNDICILDCLHLKAERTFYILDLMHWKQQPYYQAEADFRFHWINQIESEMDLTTIHPENEYKFKGLPRVRCNQQDLYQALDTAKFKVDGILFFHKSSTYVPHTSPSVLWLPPEDVEKVLGWKPPEHIMPAKKPQPPPKGDAPAADAAATTSTDTDTTTTTTTTTTTAVDESSDAAAAAATAAATTEVASNGAQAAPEVAAAT